MDLQVKQKPQVFPQTSWTLLSQVRQQGEEATAALAEFTRRYYRPVYAYIAAIVRDRDDAEEMTQEFFTTVVLSGRLLANVNRNKGSFRPYLKQTLRHYITDMRRRQERRRYQALAEAIRPDAWTDGWDRIGPGAQESPDAAFHVAWVRSLVEEALTSVREICKAKGQTDHFALFLGRYLNELPHPPSWRELGMAYKVDEKAARNRAETVARHFRLVLRELLVAEIGSESSADAEIASLLALF